MLALSFLYLAAVAAASPIFSARDYVDELDKRVDVSEEQVNTFRFYAEHSNAAYCHSESAAGSPITCGGNCPSLEADAVTIDWSIVGKLTGIGAYIATDHARGEVVLSVRGSNNIRNFLTDVNFVVRGCDLTAGCLVHSGFADSWNEIRNGGAQDVIASILAANPGYTVVATGHSLGGAVATIAGAYLRRAGIPTEIYTYGMPRAGNHAFVNFVTQQTGGEYRVTHLSDPVPRLPPIIFGYFHTSPEYWLSNGESETVDYTADDIVVCEGSANVQCNAGTPFDLDIDAHSYYLLDMSSCGAETRVVDARQEDISDEELADRLSQWQNEDIKLVEDMRS